MIDSKSALILAPHADDAELGCGGTIARLVENGTAVRVVVFARDDKRKPELKKSVGKLGVSSCVLCNIPIRNFDKYRQNILDKLVSLKKKYSPDLVIQPSMTDIHQDHQVVAVEGLRAFKNTNLWGYETLWNNLNFDAQMFVNLGERHLNKKIDAVLCYGSQDKDYIGRDYIRSVAKVRGVQIGFKYAEMFSFIRGVVK